LRILHVSHESLPDWRVEKSALTALRNGYETSFAGAKVPAACERKVFSKIYEISWSSKARYGLPFYWRSVKKAFQKVVRDANPDIVHAHNIFSAKMISELGIPFIYDDHEYWSKSTRLLLEIEEEQNRIKGDTKITNYLMNKIRRTKRKYINKKLMKLWSKWEKELVEAHPTITVSEAIAKELRFISGKKNSSVFVVPNFPLNSETYGIRKPVKHMALSSVYAGGDGGNKVRFPQRNLDGFVDIFDARNVGSLQIIGWKSESVPSSRVNYSGYLSRNEMFKELSDHSIGLMPWKKHWFHRYVSPNKAYEYAHAGLFVMYTSSIEPVKEYLLDNCLTFRDYEEMVSHLDYFKDNLEELYRKRLKSFEFARANLLWENYEKNILYAYKIS
jgi:glycosyltransferase involved in cell wall biosynthesis